MKKSKVMGFVMGALVTICIAVPPVMAAGPCTRDGSGCLAPVKNMDQTRFRQRLQDGSCLDSPCPPPGSAFKKGNTWGPGDGAGNMGVGPRDGTGFGAPANRQ